MWTSLLRTSALPVSWYQGRSIDSSSAIAARAASFWSAVRLRQAAPMPPAFDRLDAARSRARCARAGSSGGGPPAVPPAGVRRGAARPPRRSCGDAGRNPRLRRLRHPARHCMRRRYGSHFHQFADLHLPAGAGPFPVAVLLHGGFWREQHSLDLDDPLARDLARRGWAAWNVEYRRVGETSGGGYPATLEDVAAAIDFLETLDAPLDLARVVTVGQSAGGHLALWAATREAPAVPLAGAVSQAGTTDLRAADRDGLGDGATSDFMGGHADDRPDAYAKASPIERLPLGVPHVRFHGEPDDVRPPSQRSAGARAGRA